MIGRLVCLHMSASLDDVRHMAKLANISLSDTEAERYAQELTAILSYVDRLQGINTTSVEEGSVFAESLPPDRDSIEHDPEVRERVIQLFPDRLGDLLRVPSVFPNRKAS